MQGSFGQHGFCTFQNNLFHIYARPCHYDITFLKFSISIISQPLSEPNLPHQSINTFFPIIQLIPLYSFQYTQKIMRPKYSRQPIQQRPHASKCPSLCNLLEPTPRTHIDRTTAVSFYQGNRLNPKLKSQKLSISGYLAQKSKIAQQKANRKVLREQQPHEIGSPQMQIEYRQPIKPIVNPSPTITIIRTTVIHPSPTIVVQSPSPSPKPPQHKHNPTMTTIATKDFSTFLEHSQNKFSVMIERRKERESLSPNISVLSLTAGSDKLEKIENIENLEKLEDLSGSKRFKTTESVYEGSEEEGRRQIHRDKNNTVRTYTFKQKLPMSISSRQVESIESDTKREAESIEHIEIPMLRINLFGN